MCRAFSGPPQIMVLGLTRGQLYYSTNGLADSSVEHEELLKIHFFQTWPVYLVLRSQSLSMLEVIIIQGESGVKRKASGAKKNGDGVVQNRNGSRTGCKM
ncbi:hypothetical protein RHSIM_RhsimUnG0076600 [Rhododendron simsii]|uniref:Uncharacterized protein n=1 Tax=Rhododendron simsii TaxID=118357 RepID=A0A834L4Q4_RHOSS|nr:hypothetical protein RHSIM_RhsimUnG0076600 [Rhododendron simsii]